MFQLDDAARQPRNRIQRFFAGLGSSRYMRSQPVKFMKHPIKQVFMLFQSGDDGRQLLRSLGLARFEMTQPSLEMTQSGVDGGQLG